MILGRKLSNSSSKFLPCAVASTHYYSFLVPTYNFNFDNVREIRRFCSRTPRFDFGSLRGGDDAIALFQNMMRMQPRPSVIDFTKLLSAVVKMKQYSIALHLFDEMLQRDAPLNHYTLSVAIDCYCKVKRPDLAFAVLGGFFKRGYEPTVVTFTTLIRGVLSIGRIDDAATLLRKLMNEQLCIPNVFTYNSMIHCLCRSGRWNEAQDWLNEMVVHRVYPDVVTCTVLVNAFSKKGRLEAATHILDIMKEIDLQPNIRTYTCLMHGYLKMGRVDEVSCVFIKIRAEGLEQNVVSYTTMLQALLSEGRVEDGLNLFKEMEALHVSPDIVTHNILLDGLCNAHLIAEAFSVLHSMEKEKGIIANIITYNTLIKGLGNNDKVREAEDLFHELPSKGLQPDVVTYTILIGALCREGKIDEAKDLLLQMVKNGCLPNRVTYNVFVRGLVKRNNIEEATHLLEEMNSKGFRPSTTTFSSIILPLRMVKEGLDSVLFYKLSELVPN